MPVKIGSFKGKATITLNPDSKWPFSFGPEKAALIVANFEEIRKFSTAYPPKQKAQGPAGKVWAKDMTADPMGFDRSVEDAYADQCGLRGGGQ